MKLISLLFLLCSFSAFASDAGYDTGTFEIDQPMSSSPEALRLPASVESEKDADVTTLTGTFE